MSLAGTLWAVLDAVNAVSLTPEQYLVGDNQLSRSIWGSSRCLLRGHASFQMAGGKMMRKCTVLDGVQTRGGVTHLTFYQNEVEGVMICIRCKKRRWEGTQHWHIRPHPLLDRPKTCLLTPSYSNTSSWFLMFLFCSSANILQHPHCRLYDTYRVFIWYTSTSLGVPLATRSSI
jgi:hypothetical protein